jgi:hypothetical protein
LSLNSIADSIGNLSQDTASYTNFLVDTTSNNDEFSILSTNLNDSTQKNISPSFNVFNKFSPFKLKFSKIPYSKSLKNTAYLLSNNDTISVELKSNDLLEYFFVSEKGILENTDYVLVFDTKGVTGLWGNSLVKDTVYRTKFKTKFSPKLSSISGEIVLKSGCEGNIIVTAKNVTDKTEYKITLTDSKWRFDEVTTGSYIFEIFCDENKNGKYDFGKVDPFEYREKYSKSKSYKIDENWEYNDIKLMLDE